MPFSHIFAILSYMKSLSLSKPHLIIVVGIPGSGKSYFADKFAETFHAPIVSRGRIANFLERDLEAVEAIAHNQLNELVKTGQSIVLDGLGDNRTARAELAKSARAAGYSCLTVWVQTDPATAKSRSSRKNAETGNRRLEGDDYDRAAKEFIPPTAIEKPVVISGKHTYATQAKVILKKLSEPRAAAISTHATAPVRPDPQSNRRNITIR
jgi:predicted kinase